MRAKQTGFTLVELVVVIVILGILAATALPRFISLSSDARLAAAQGIGGGLRSAAAAAQGRYFATGNMTATTTTMADGTAVTVTAATGVPAATNAGIGAAMHCESATTCQGSTVAYAGTTATFTPPNTTSATCVVTYVPTSGGTVTAPTTLAQCAN